MTTWIAFFFAFLLVIFVHELGHYLLALYWRVSVHRFSIGFGRPLFIWKSIQPGLHSVTEFSINIIPLGGYVKFKSAQDNSDEMQDIKHTFESQSLLVRTSIVLAGPLINLVFAFLIYASLNWTGYERHLPVLSKPPPASLADQAGLSSGDLVTKLSFDHGEWQSIESMDQLQWLLLSELQQAMHMKLVLKSSYTGDLRVAEINLLQLKSENIDPINSLGILGPRRDPFITRVLSGGVASKAGLLSGDRVLSIDGQKIVDAAQIIRLVRSATGEQNWEILRSGKDRFNISIYPQNSSHDAHAVKKIDAVIGNASATNWVADGLMTGLGNAASKVLLQIKLTLTGFMKIFYTADGWKNLGGPLYIADIAGKSADESFHRYVGFIAIFSLSIGILNLLPIPLLDGGHLLYYLWEALYGKPASALWQERLSIMGMVIIFSLVFLTFFNDFLRWFR
jgi:regulator of sigma E protease